jgi:hypothetical protein
VIIKFEMGEMSNLGWFIGQSARNTWAGSLQSCTPTAKYNESQMDIEVRPHIFRDSRHGK